MTGGGPTGAVGGRDDGRRAHRGRWEKGRWQEGVIDGVLLTNIKETSIFTSTLVCL